MQFEALWRGELSLRLNDASTTLFTSTRRQQAIHDAVEEFVDLTECLVRQSTIACSCNVTEYALLSSATLQHGGDFLRIAKQGVEYLRTDSNGRLFQTSGDDFPRRDIEWLNRYRPNWRESTTPVDTPEGYYVREDGGAVQIGLTEPPDVGSSETAVLRVPYVLRPEPLTSSSAEPFTVNGSVRTDLRIYHKALPHYAAHKLLPLVGDKQGAEEELQLFLGYVARHAQNTRPKGGQHVTVARSYLRESQRMGGMDPSALAEGRWGRRA